MSGLGNIVISVLTGFLLKLCWVIQFSQQAPCTYRQMVGSGEITKANVNSPDPVDTNVTILMANTIGRVECCGVVLAWDVFVEGQGFIALQVWRPVQGEVNKYMLLGSNGIRHRSTGVSQVGRSIPDRNLIHVVPGDVLGFLQSEVSILRYTTCDPASPTEPDICAEDMLINAGAPEPEVGDLVDFMSEQSSYLGTSTVRGYAVIAYLDEKSPATCTDKHVTISDTLNVGDHVTNANADYMDLNHPNSSFAIESVSPSFPVTIDPRSGEVKVSGTLTPAYPSTDYILTVRIVDVCSGTNTCSVTVTVNNDPKAITFITLPAHKELSSLDGEVFSFKISPQRDDDDVICYITSTLPEILLFEVKNKSKTDYGIHLLEAAKTHSIFENEALVTVLQIACENSEGKYNQSTLTLTYRSERNGVGILLSIVGVVISLVVLAMVAVLMFWLCHKGKIKVWPSNSHDLQEGTKHGTGAQEKDKNTKQIKGREDRNRTGALWDNFSSFYKVEQNVTSGRLPVEWDSQLAKTHRATFFAHRDCNGQVLKTAFEKYSTFPAYVFHKKPWRP